MLTRTQLGGVCVLALDRPTVGNALDPALVEALLDVLPEVAADTATHTLFLHGNGRHFCTGFDLSRLAEESDGDLLQRFVRVEELLACLWHLPLRTVVWASGRTLGAGADLLTCADLRIATPTTQIAFPGVRFGLALGTRRLAARIGAGRALTGLTEGRLWNAAEALTEGLLDAVTETPWDRWVTEQLPQGVVDRASYAHLKSATRPDHRDADLALLVRSASRPGLHARLRAYRESLART